MSIAKLRRTIAGVRVSNLFDAPGKPTGWTHHRERDLIRKHLLKRLGPIGESGMDFARREQRVSRIQDRMHKYDKTFRELQTLYRSKLPPRTGAGAWFNVEELERLIDHFEGANDPVGQAIAEKARKALDSIVFVA